MRRFLLNPIANNLYGTANVAMVWVSRDSARRWMRLMEIYLEADRQMDGDLAYLLVWNNKIRFFERWPLDIEELVDRLSDEGHIEISDEIDADFSALPNVPMDACRLVVDGKGVAWEAYEKYGGMPVSTPFIPWDTIKAIADEAEPTNNNGRTRCWWCGTGTVEVPLFTGVVAECPDCRK